MIAPNLLHTAQKHCCVLYLTSDDELVILTGSHILSSSPQIFYLQTSSFSFPLLCSYSRLIPRSSSFSPPSPLPAPIPCYPLPTTASTWTSPPSPLLKKIQPSKSEDLIGFIQPFINWEASHLEHRRALWKAVKWVQLCGSLNILGHCLSLGLAWKLTFSNPVAIAEFSTFTGSTFTASSFRVWNSSAGNSITSTSFVRSDASEGPVHFTLQDVWL